MIFRKNIEPRCAYCEKSRELSESELLCAKHGVVPVAYSCRSFRYDPLKRTPPTPVRLKKTGVTDEDFKL